MCAGNVRQRDFLMHTCFYIKKSKISFTQICSIHWILLSLFVNQIHQLSLIWPFLQSVMGLPLCRDKGLELQGLLPALFESESAIFLCASFFYNRFSKKIIME